MDITQYSLEDLLLSAIKSEVESNKIYSKLADLVKNGLLKDKFTYLAKEEAKHKIYVESLFKKQFPNKTVILPDNTPVPLPEVTIPDENIPLSNILKQAMQAEKAAQDFYTSLAPRFARDQQIHHTLIYFADMELGHYKILEVEKESMERFEAADVYWPMVHAGP